MTKLENIEADYWWEIKALLEYPTREGLLDFLEQIYEEGFNQGMIYGEESLYD